jgi:formylglycine-generating enzyme required for sulfatase activity
MILLCRGEYMVRIRATVFLQILLSAASLFAQADMVLVEGGTFQMGSAGGWSNERPVHEVTVAGFYIGKYEVTQKEWAEIMGDHRGKFKGDNLPMGWVSWYDAVEYCNRLSRKEGLTPAYQGSGYRIVCDFNASGYRLPTEAEWEYAAKGGNKDVIPYEYSGGNNLDEVAWHWGNSKGRPHPVGTKQPNSLGIYDMSGSVWEWCWDRARPYTGEAQTNPTGHSEGGFLIYRGGSWRSDSADYMRSTFRSHSQPVGWNYEVGFRVVRSK